MAARMFGTELQGSIMHRGMFHDALHPRSERVWHSFFLATCGTRFGANMRRALCWAAGFTGESRG